MRTFEPTSAWLREASNEMKENADKHSLGLTRAMVDPIAEIVAAAEDLIRFEHTDGSRALEARKRLRACFGKAERLDRG